MKKNHCRLIAGSLLFLALFALWTAAIRLLDVQPIGPLGSPVGLARMNAAFHHLTGVHMNLYLLTDWLSLIPVFVMMGFAAAGLVQWIRRRSLARVDADLLLLGGLYAALLGAYLLFERFPVNHRPVLIDGFLEASYPSSTTLLVLTVIPSAAIQACRRISAPAPRYILIGLAAVFAFLMVLGRLWSGVHWLSDVIGGILLSASLLKMYVFSCCLLISR